jgi:hypothetical protein
LLTYLGPFPWSDSLLSSAFFFKAHTPARRQKLGVGDRLLPLKDKFVLNSPQNHWGDGAMEHSASIFSETRRCRFKSCPLHEFGFETFGFPLRN